MVLGGFRSFLVLVLTGKTKPCTVVGFPSEQDELSCPLGITHCVLQENSVLLSN